jgi:hypothetical protein
MHKKLLGYTLRLFGYPVDEFTSVRLEISQFKSERSGGSEVPLGGL